jgi:hypothetical protein
MPPRTRYNDLPVHRPNKSPPTKDGPFWRKNQKYTFYDHEGIYTLLCEHRVIDYWLLRERLSLKATRLIDW